MNPDWGGRARKHGIFHEGGDTGVCTCQNSPGGTLNAVSLTYIYHSKEGKLP